MKESAGMIGRFARTTALAAGTWLLIRRLRQRKDFTLRNRVVLITGGSRGLGLELARKVTREGATVVICARNKKSLKRADAELSAWGGNVLAIPCDVTDKEQVRKMIQQIRTEKGRIDALINNAGTIQVGPMETMTLEDYQTAMDIHFWGAVNVTNEVLPEMKSRREGRIVNIVSIGGKVSVPHLSPYCASKFALSGWSEGLTAELGRYKIKVTTVYPGLMRTGSPRNVWVKGQFRKEYALFKVLDSLPVLSINSGKAAERIVKAMKRGSTVLTLTGPAKLAMALEGVSPGLVVSTLRQINRLLPRPTGVWSRRKGYESESRWSSNLLTRMTEQAAVRNMEVS